mmetsp:Transcript_6619/g.8984  ORF Transcript_6619/g.8984 Transcript_6619/m.8984 type:complete len:221 (+) Transcript_6619:795-1457(+)
MQVQAGGPTGGGRRGHLERRAQTASRRGLPARFLRSGFRVLRDAVLAKLQGVCRANQHHFNPVAGVLRESHQLHVVGHHHRLCPGGAYGTSNGVLQHTGCSSKGVVAARWSTSHHGRVLMPAALDRGHRDGTTLLRLRHRSLLPVLGLLRLRDEVHAHHLEGPPGASVRHLECAAARALSPVFSLLRAHAAWYPAHLPNAELGALCLVLLPLLLVAADCA